MQKQVVQNLKMIRRYGRLKMMLVCVPPGVRSVPRGYSSGANEQLRKYSDLPNWPDSSKTSFKTNVRGHLGFF